MEQQTDLLDLITSGGTSVPTTGGGGATASDRAVSPIAGREPGRAAEPPKSDTVLDVDHWTARKGRMTAERWRRSAAMTYPTDDAKVIARAIKPQDRAHLAADAIDTLLATEPMPAENPTDELRAEWWRQLLASPELAGLRARTMHKPDVAMIAADELAATYARFLEQQQGSGGGGAGEGGEKKNKPGDAIGKAKQAADDANALKEAFGLGADLTPGQERQMDIGMLSKLAQQMRHSERLRDILKMAGRFMARAAQLRAQRVEVPGMETTGLELSGDIGRLLPVEAGMVSGIVPEMELTALLRVSQRRAMSYKRNTHANERGPVVYSVDESGSMDGERIIAAKALTLAAVAQARADKRPFTLIAWSNNGRGRVFHSTTDAQADITGMVGWLSAFEGGGTDLAIPLGWATRQWDGWPTVQSGKGRADHIIITDDTGEAHAETVRGYVAWAKEKRVRTFGFTVGGARKGEEAVSGLVQYCDGGAWAIPKIDPNADGIADVLKL